MNMQMQITHEEARKLIHFNADEALKGMEKNVLEEHLQSCLECRSYAGKIEEVESTLGHIMQRKWNRQPLPFHKSVSISKNNSKLIQNALLATRIAAMSILCIAVLFNIWQFTQSAGPASNPSAASVLPAPTPSLLYTSTQILDQNCDQVSYTVRANDTLENIAERFSSSKEEILAVNNMREGILHPSMDILIPVCNTTTPGTPNTVMTTFTPLGSSTTSTPIKGPTQ